MNSARKCRWGSCLILGSWFGKWRVSIRCNSTRPGSAAEAALPAAVEMNSRVRTRHIPTAPAEAVNHLRIKVFNGIDRSILFDFIRERLVSSSFYRLVNAFLTTAVRRRNVAICVLGFGTPLNVTVNYVLVSFDRCGNRNRHWWFYIAVYCISGRSIRAVVCHRYLRRRYVPNVGVIILLVISVLWLKLLLRLTCVKTVVLIELRRLLAIRGRHLRKVILYVQRYVRRGSVHVQIRGLFIRSNIIENCAVRRHRRSLYGITLRYLKQMFISLL